MLWPLLRCLATCLGRRCECQLAEGVQPFQDGLFLLQLQLSDMVHPSVVIRGAGREHKTVRPRSIHVRIDEEPHALLRLTLPQRSEGDRPSTALAHVGALDQLRGAT